MHLVWRSKLWSTVVMKMSKPRKSHTSRDFYLISGSSCLLQVSTTPRLTSLQLIVKKGLLGPRRIRNAFRFPKIWNAINILHDNRDVHTINITNFNYTFKGKFVDRVLYLNSSRGIQITWLLAHLLKWLCLYLDFLYYMFPSVSYLFAFIEI